MRGKLGLIGDHGRHVRLIPAHAGKTSSFSWLLRRSAAYPRSRGENILRASDKGVDPGSSPLTRGKHDAGYARRPGLRLIPAHAGKTCIGGCATVLCRAHPRSRGENHSVREGNTHTQGSSPLTRGKHPGRPHRGQGHRFIPAHAGKNFTS